MSLLWPKPLQVALSAQGAAIIGTSTDAEKNKPKQAYMPVTQNVEATSWHLACNRLDALLSDKKVNANTRLSIVLSSDFIRYQLLPTQQIAMSEAEKLAYAAASYNEVYGADSAGWKLKLHETGFKQTSITAAVEQNFLEKLQQVTLQHKIKLLSVQPYLMIAYNSCKNQLSKLNGYFVVVETSKILLLNMQQGKLKSLRTTAINHDWQQDLKQLLARESMLNEDIAKEILLHAPINKSLLKMEGWQVNHIRATYLQSIAGSHIPTLAASL